MMGDEDENPTFFWMTNDVKYSCDKKTLCGILSLICESRKKEYRELMYADRLEILDKAELMDCFYKKDSECTLCTTKNMETSYLTLQNILGITLCPKVCNFTNIRSLMRNLFVILTNSDHVDFAKFMLRGILNA